MNAMPMWVKCFVFSVGYMSIDGLFVCREHKESKVFWCVEGILGMFVEFWYVDGSGGQDHCGRKSIRRRRRVEKCESRKERKNNENSK